MKYLSVCSGIEAATVAWHPLGWTPLGFAEIEAFPSAVLAHHYGSNLPGEPLASNGVPNFGDITAFKDWPDAAFDVLVGGTPCQSFSVAGLRKGMADPRGNLALVYLAIADRYRPEWLVWENVPGVLSSSEGRDFGAFLGGLAELGYGFAYRVLDAQYVRVDGFGRAVPQRRRRVFVVGNSRNWRRAAAVLLEPESMSGNSPPRREARERIAPTISSRPTGGGGLGTETETVIAHALSADGFDASEDGTGRGTPIVPVVAGTMKALKDSGGWSNSVDHAAAGYMLPVAKTLTRGAESAGKGGYTGRRQEDDDNLVVQSNDASSPKTHALEALLSLRQTIGAEAFEEWGQGVAHSFQPAEILRSGVHGGGLRREADEGNGGLDDRPLSRSESRPSGPVRDLWEAGRERRAPSGRRLSEQLAGQLGAALSKLSHEGAQAEGFLLDLRRASEGAGVLQSPLPSIQRGPTWAVRRLTPVECARLQGFPDDYLSQVTWRGQSPPADGPMYKALGNSMAVNCMRWIGTRIAMVANLAGATP